jgi:hypothetical protein
MPRISDSQPERRRSVGEGSTTSTDGTHPPCVEQLSDGLTEVVAFAELCRLSAPALAGEADALLRTAQKMFRVAATKLLSPHG